MRREHSGVLGWGLLAAGVAAWDILAPESLSHACKRGLENPYTRPLVLGVMAVTAAHLVSVLPEQIDPFRFIPTAADRLAQLVPLDIDLDNLTED